LLRRRKTRLVWGRRTGGSTASTVGVPNLRFPISLNAWPTIFRNFVHRTTSHGTFGESEVVISVISPIFPEKDDIRECTEEGVGDRVSWEEKDDNR
jgi:hypothetical protein